MSGPISYAPPARTVTATKQAGIRRRHVLYVPGYDPEAKSRARALFVRELGRYGRRFGLAKTVTRPVDLPDAPVTRWTVQASRDGWRVDTVYDVMRWDDIVQTDFRRSAWDRAWAAMSVLVRVVWTGLAGRLYRMNRIFAGVFAYPYVLLLLLILGATGLGFLVDWGARRGLGLSGAASLGLGIGVALVGAGIAARSFGRLYVWHLLLDWVFNWEHGAGERPDYDERVELFAAHLVEVAARGEADEILVVGHSSGAGMAMEMASRALALDPGLGRHGPDIALLTLGTSLPAAAFNLRAERIHANLRRIMTARDVLWVEYQAPQDWLNAAWFNPVRMLPLGLTEAQCVNPVIRSPRFTDIVDADTYALMRKNPFRMHFQFMMANDKAGEFDFFMIALGPLSLGTRIALPDDAASLVAPVTDRVEAAATLRQSVEVSETAS